MVLPESQNPPEALPPQDAATPDAQDSGVPSQDEITQQQQNVFGPDSGDPSPEDAQGSMRELPNVPPVTSDPSDSDSTNVGDRFSGTEDDDVKEEGGTGQGGPTPEPTSIPSPSLADPNSGTGDSSQNSSPSGSTSGSVDSSSGTGSADSGTGGQDGQNQASGTGADDHGSSGVDSSAGGGQGN